MREDHKRLRELILKQFELNNIKPKSEKAKIAEHFMIVGYLAMQAEIEERIDPYLTILLGSGRRLTQEEIPEDVAI